MVHPGWLRIGSAILVVLGMSDPVAAQAQIDALREQCAQGRINPSFLKVCQSVIREDVLQHASDAELNGGFFDWLAANPRLGDDAHLAMALYGSKVASNLRILHSSSGRAVERHPSLAVAFAAAWSSGAGANPERFWTDPWLTQGRDVPGMTESFSYYTESSEELRIPVREAPWQILAHLADSLVPIEERLWALERYRDCKTEELRERFADVPYTLEPQRTDHCYTLESFLKFGGPCTHNVQFAGGVFDAFGIPSGWAGGPGHTYPYWFEFQGQEITIHRCNELGNRNGKIRDPLGPGYLWEDDLRLLVASLARSIPAHRRAAYAAWAYRRVPADGRAETAPILLGALAENPLCATALSAVAHATRQQHLSLEQAGSAWKTIRSALADRPLDLLPLLELAVPPFGAGAPSFDGDLALLLALERDWRDGGHSEALARIPFLRARCLAARGKHSAASSVLLEIAGLAVAADPQRFTEATAAMLASLPAGVARERRLEVLRELIAIAEPSPRAGWTTVHRSRFHAIRLLVAELTLLQREEEALAYWYAELEAAQSADRGIRAESGLVGGSGGGPFADAPPGAVLIGLRVSTTDFDGRSVIGSIRGIYRVAGAEILGALAGQERAGAVELKAPEGWRVAGLVAAGSDRFDGFQLVFAPSDPSDSRIELSAWTGSRAEHEALLGGRGVRVVGIRGRAGADVDAIGLVGILER